MPNADTVEEVRGGAEEQFNFNDLAGYEAETARWLAIGLLILFALAIVCQYALITIFASRSETGSTHGVVSPVIERLERLFDIVLPVLSGLVGAAATFFFSRERR